MKKHRNTIKYGDEVSVSASSKYGRLYGTINDDNFFSIKDCIYRISQKFKEKEIGCITIYNQTKETIGYYKKSGKKFA